MARDLDLTESSVRRWVEHAEIDAGRKPGLTSSEHEELVRLRKENRGAARGARHSEASDGFLRQRESVNTHMYRSSRRRRLDSAASTGRARSWRSPEPPTTSGTTSSTSRRAQEDLELTEQVKAIFKGSRRTYGSPRVHSELRQRGRRCSRKRVERLMRQEGLQGRPPKRRRRTTIPDPEPPPELTDLIGRRFDPSELALNAYWAGDITPAAYEATVAARAGTAA